MTGYISQTGIKEHWTPLLLYFIIVAGTINFCAFPQTLNPSKTEAKIKDVWRATAFNSVGNIDWYDSLTGVATGFSNFYSTTTDGGKSWFTRKMASAYLNFGGFISRDTFVLSHFHRTNYITYDGGQTFSPMPLSSDQSIIAKVIFTSTVSGIALADSGKIFHTTNSGASWQSVYEPDSSVILDIYYDGTTAYVFGQKGHIIKSTDKGVTWSDFFFDNKAIINSMKKIGDFLYLGTASQLYLVTSLSGIIVKKGFLPNNPNVSNFVFQDNGIWALDKTKKEVYFNPNNSEEWEIFPVYTKFETNKLFAVNNRQIAVGNSGALLILDQGGGAKYSFEKLSFGEQYNFKCVKVVSPQLILAGTSAGELFRSTDEGHSWTRVATNIVSQSFNTIACSSPSFIVAAGEMDLMIKSTDEGITWTRVTAGFPNSIRSVATSFSGDWYYCSPTRLYKAVGNNLQSWNMVNISVSYPDMKRVKFNDNLNGWLAGSHPKIYSTTNGGINWVGAFLEGSPEMVYYPGISRVYLKEGNIIWSDEARNFSILAKPLTELDVLAGNGHHEVALGGKGAAAILYPQVNRIDFLQTGLEAKFNELDNASTFSIAVADKGIMVLIRYGEATFTPLVCNGLMPVADSLLFDTKVNLIWDEPYSSSEVLKYGIEISLDTISNILLADTNIILPQYEFNNTLRGRNYFWRVKGANRFGWGAFSNWNRFYVNREEYSIKFKKIDIEPELLCITAGPDGKIWTGGSSGSLFYTTSFNLGWQAEPTGITGGIVSLAVNPVNSKRIAVNSSGNIYISGTVGENWQQVTNSSEGFFTSVVFSEDSKAYACGKVGLIAVSTNYGLNWTNLPNLTTLTDFMTINKVGSDIATAGTDGYVAINSTDQGTFSLFRPAPGKKLLHISLFKNRLTVFDGTGRYFSKSGANDWVGDSVNVKGTITGVIQKDSGVLMMDNTNNLYFYKGNEYPTDIQFIKTPSPVSKIFLGNGGELFGVGANGVTVNGVPHNPDSLKTWKKLLLPVSNKVRIVEILSGGVVLVGCESGLILRSTDYGVTWSTTDIANGREIKCIKQFTDGRCFITGNGGLLLVSSDQGASWQEINAGLEEYSLFSIDFLNFTNGVIGANKAKIFRSSDGGNTWNSSQEVFNNPGCEVTNIKYEEGGSIVASAFYDTRQFFIHISSNQTVSYPSPIYFSENRKVIYFGDGRVFFVSFYGGKGYFSCYYPSTYLVSTSEMINTNFTSISVTPSGSVYLGDDYGKVYTRLIDDAVWGVTENLANKSITWLAFSDPQHGFAVTSDGFLFKYVDPTSGTGSESGNDNPVNFAVWQNYPNPFNNSTILPVSLEKQGNISVILYSVTGEEVRKVFDGEMSSGKHELSINTIGLASGVYLCRVVFENGAAVKKMILLK